MSVTIPTSKPPMLRALEADFGTTIAEAIWRKVIQHINWMNAQFPIGLVMWFYQTTTVDQFGNPSPSYLQVGAPNDSWKLCDGSVVSDVNSPLNGVTMPNLLGKFPKAGLNGAIGLEGGRDGFTLGHNHGQTQAASDGDFSAPRSDNSDEARGYNTHGHIIPHFYADISTTPFYFCLQPYMRVR